MVKQKYPTILFLSSVFSLLMLCSNVKSQVIDNTLTPQQLIQNVLIGGGVTVSNITFQGNANMQTGSFSGFNFGITDGMVLSTGDVMDIPSNAGTNASTQIQPNLSVPFDADILQLLQSNPNSANALANDGAIIEFDFIPLGNLISFDYVFASEEYPEYVCSFNDAFGMFLSGPGITGPYTNNARNIAVIPNTTLDVSIYNINPPGGACAWSGNNANLYIDNQGGNDFVFDGQTVVLTAQADVICGQTYHLKIAIVDAGDRVFDSGVFLKAQSLISNQISFSAVTPGGNGVLVEGCEDGQFQFVRQDNLNQPLSIPIFYTGTASMGIDYNNLPSEIVFQPGQNSVTINVVANVDGIVEGTETITATIIQQDCDGTLTNFEQTLTINELALNLTSIDSMLCVGDNEANFSVEIIGGDPPFTWDVNPLILNANGNFTTNQGGTYIVSVTDAGNCSVSLNVNVFQEPTPFTVIEDEINNVSCFGFNDGKISLIPMGGSAPYSFTVLQSPALNNSTGQFLNLPPGEYTITGTDSYGCSYVFNYTITQPSAPLLATIFAQDPVRCYGEPTGRIIIGAQGGTPPYEFANGLNTIYTNPAIFDNLFAGPDNILVVDANGCNVTVPFVMTQPLAPMETVISNLQNVTCLPVVNGSISINVSGGSPVFPGIYDFALYMQQPDLTYLNMENNQTGVFGGLNIGNYYIVVSDNNDCERTVVFDITGPTTELGINLVVQTHNICYGGNIGRLFFTGTGGTPPYQHYLNNQLLANNDVSGLVAGSYVLKVIDANGCEKEEIHTILEPDFYQLQFVNVQPALCFGECSGIVQMNTIGGTAPYTYSLNGIDANNTGLFSNVCEGPFSVTVTDGNGCTLTQNNTVLAPVAPLDAILVLNNGVTCFGSSNGSFYIQAIGGTADYNYTITGQTSGIAQFNQNGVFNGLPADDYDVLITDAAGCTHTEVVTVNTPTAPLIISTVDTRNITCFGDTTGRICFNVTGGIAPYSFVCMNNATVNPEGYLANGNTCFRGLTAGSFTITVTDAQGCSASITNTLTQPSNPLTANATVSDVTCYGGSNGAISISTAGGTLPYQYAINTNPFVFTAVSVFQQLPSAIYEITVRDANLCTFVLQPNVGQPSLPLASEIVLQTQLNCVGSQDACVTVAAIATTGSVPFTYTYNGVTNTTGLFCGFGQGLYSIIVSDANNCTAVQNVTFNNPPELEANIIFAKQVSCFGGEDGMLKVGATGGTPGSNPSYFYEWIGLPSQADSAVNLMATTYCAVVKDSLGCRDTTCATLTQPNKILTIGVGDANICIGDSVQLTMNGTGGTPDYTFTWLPNGVMQDPPLTGTPIVVKPETTTYYLIEIEDSRGCKSDYDTLIVTVHPLPTANFIAEKRFICQDECVEFRDISLISSVTGDSIVNWKWKFDNANFVTSFNPTHCYNLPGKKTVQLIVYTNIGCRDTVALENIVTVYPKPDIDFQFTPNPASLVDPKISFLPKIQEDNTYFWNFGDGNVSDVTSPIHLYSDTGTYEVVLTQISENGCIDSLMQLVKIDPILNVYVPNAFTPNNDGLNDNFIVVGKYLTEYSLTIFNRFGEKIFETTELNQFWDGNNEGQPALSGSYSWNIRAKDVNGNKIVKSGMVTLVR